jgi:hypothetical protein
MGLAYRPILQPQSKEIWPSELHAVRHQGYHQMLNMIQDQGCQQCIHRHPRNKRYLYDNPVLFVLL